MHSAIIWVKPPDDVADQDWVGFSRAISTVRGNPGLSRLAENVWLVNFQQAPSAFARIVAACDHHKFYYGILPLEHVPQWLPAGFDPKTI
jgi:hypothetical protein